MKIKEILNVAKLVKKAVVAIVKLIKDNKKNDTQKDNVKNDNSNK